MYLHLRSLKLKPFLSSAFECYTEIHEELGIYVESEMHTCVSQMTRDSAFPLVDCREIKQNRERA
jgi:hypothetical protein